ncbi:MAG: hypothetical protein RLY93_10660 [Sumerlaeia bacterium]
MLCLRALTPALFGELRRREDFTLAQSGELLLPPRVVSGGSDRRRRRLGDDRIFVGAQSIRTATLARVVDEPAASVEEEFLASPYVATWRNDVGEGEDPWLALADLHRLAANLEPLRGEPVARIFNRPETFEIYPFHWEQARTPTESADA